MSNYFDNFFDDFKRGQHIVTRNLAQLSHPFVPSHNMWGRTQGEITNRESITGSRYYRTNDIYGNSQHFSGAKELQFISKFDPDE